MKSTKKRFITFIVSYFILIGAFPFMSSGTNAGEKDEGMNELDIDLVNETNLNTQISTCNVTISDFGNFDIAAAKSQQLTIEYGIGSHPAVTGEYTNETQMIFLGISDPESRNLSVTVKMNITNETNDIIQENVTNQKICDVCGGLTYVTFDWTPAREGIYHINLSYNCTDFGDRVYYVGGNLTVVIANVTSYNAEIVVLDDTLQENEYLTAWIIVNNTGNQIHDFGYSINVTKVGGWDYGEHIFTGLLEHIYDMDEHNHTFSLLMEKGGDYTIAVTFDLDGGTVAETFLVQALHGTLNGKVNDTRGENVAGANVIIMNGTNEWFNHTTNATGEYSAELLLGIYEIYVNATGYDDSSNETFTLLNGIDEKLDFTMQPWEPPLVYTAPTLVDLTGHIDAYAGDEIVFDVLYTDADGDIGDVRIKLDAWNDTDKDMINWSWEEGIFVPMVNDTNNWIDGVNFSYASKALENMTYRYTVKAIDPVLGPVITTPIEFTVKAVLPTTGLISGMITTGTGNDGMNISNAKVVIYYIEVVKIMNETTVTGYDNLTHWFNTTTVNGSYTQILAFNTYMIYVEHGDYKDVFERIFTLDLIHLVVTKDFTLIKKEPVIPTYKITGKVVPVDATVKQGNNTVTVDNITGAFEISGLENNTTVILTFLAEGYDAQTREITLNESRDVDIGSVAMYHVPLTYTVTIGPFTDVNHNLLSHVKVTITWLKDSWIEESDAVSGIATFINMPWASIPANAVVTVEYGEETKTIDPNDQEDLIWDIGKEGSSIIIWIITIVVAVLIVIIVLLLIMKRKKPETAGIDLEEESVEEGIGEDFDDDMKAPKEKDIEMDFNDISKEAPREDEVSDDSGPEPSN